MKRSLFVFLQLFFIVFFSASSCKKTETEIDVKFTVPTQISLKSSDTSFDFKILFGKAPKTGDFILFSGTQDYECRVKDVSAKKFTIDLPTGVVSGRYDVYFKRGTRSMFVGPTYITLVSDSGKDVKPVPGATVYGVVYCGDELLGDVVVSDGVELVKTDKNGVYQMNSAKKNGYVFVSVPRGYEAPVAGVFPVFWQNISSSASSAERVDFELLKHDNDNFTLYVMGDMHLANKQGDLTQFRTFMKDLSATVNATSGRQYGLTLGDMSWDYYWYSKPYGLADYKSEMNKNLTGVCLFNTMGNHDNDYRCVGDFAKEQAYRDGVAPVYYSYNIGKVHFVVLDNINYMNGKASVDDESGKIIQDYRSDYTCNFTKDQMDWLKKDLSTIDKSTPVIISSHAPVYRPSGATGRRNGLLQNGDAYGSDEFREVIKDYNVLFFSGHTHNMFNVDDSAKGFYESNAGAVCGTWWWSGYFNPGFNLSQDGTPGGYTILKANGTSLTWTYKGAGYPEDCKFRTYDINEAKKVLVNSLGADAEGWRKMVSFVSSYADNTVLLNVWGYDPKWTVNVTENGEKLPVTRVEAYDPLHMLVMSAPRFTSGSKNFVTVKWQHFFLVRASSPDSTLEIEVTDRFGKKYTETMKRPKIFSKQTYKFN